jgi:hypothetical protein
MSAQTSTTTSGVGKAIVSRVAQVGVDDITSKDELLSHLLGEVQQLGRKAMVLPHDASNEIWDKEEVEQAAANLEGPEVMVENAGNKKLVIAENPHKDIREAITDLLVRCNLSFAAIPYDREFHNACCDVARSKGYAIDAPSLQPFIPGGVVIATTTYAHLENKSTQIIIALYTAFLIYIDDVHQNDVGGIYGFNERFVLCQPQDDPVLESLASLLRELPKHFGRVSSNMMISSTLNFVTSLILDYETKDMPASPDAGNYAAFSRVMCGASETYAMFVFPTQIPLPVYIQAFPEVMNFLNKTNDVLSFYKEELAGETINHISNMARCRGVSKIEVLRLLCDEVVTCHLQSLNILSPHHEAHAVYSKFSQGYIDFHTSLTRYRLDELFS